MKFKDNITSVAPKVGAASGEPNFEVIGKLTIKGIVNDITFPASITIKCDKNRITNRLLPVLQNRYLLHQNKQKFIGCRHVLHCRHFNCA